MLRNQAEPLLALLQEAYGKELSEPLQAFYLKRLIDCDCAPMALAIDAIIDTERHFPRWSVLRERYDAERARGREADSKRPDSVDVPLTPDELHRAAEDMATEAAARRARHGGKADALCVLLERAANVYAENARRRARGVIPELPIPSFRQIVTVMTAQAALQRSVNEHSEACDCSECLPDALGCP